MDRNRPRIKIEMPEEESRWLNLKIPNINLNTPTSNPYLQRSGGGQISAELLNNINSQNNLQHQVMVYNNSHRIDLNTPNIEMSNFHPTIQSIPTPTSLLKTCESNGLNLLHTTCTKNHGKLNLSNINTPTNLLLTSPLLNPYKSPVMQNLQNVMKIQQNVVSQNVNSQTAQNVATQNLTPQNAAGSGQIPQQSCIINNESPSLQNIHNNLISPFLSGKVLNSNPFDFKIKNEATTPNKTTSSTSIQDFIKNNSEVVDILQGQGEETKKQSSQVSECEGSIRVDCSPSGSMCPGQNVEEVASSLTGITQPSVAVTSVASSSATSPRKVPNELKTTQKRGRKRAEESDTDAQLKRQKFLERNRRAAARCREKKKQWILDLEANHKQLNIDHKLLISEYEKLKHHTMQLENKINVDHNNRYKINNQVEKHILVFRSETFGDSEAKIE